MQRLYTALIHEHFREHEEMVFLSGPRQVGKTTVSETLGTSYPYCYLNWDDEDHRAILLENPSAIIDHAKLQQLQQLHQDKPVIAFDEIHKRPDWKNFLKGFYDSYKSKYNIIVTGSARLDVYNKGGDSLMGRYFPYRMHPLSVAEILRTTLHNETIAAPALIPQQSFADLLNYGGYPKPFLKHNPMFSNRWQRLRKQQLLQEDIRDINVINDLHRLQLLQEILQRRASQAITYSNLANHVRVSVDTIRRWLEILETFYYCYLIRPWSKNISKALTKEPKVYLWDWSINTDPGARTENFIASHLLKAVHYWTDRGFDNYDLYYIRDTQKREVDFVVTRNDKVWFLVEVKHSKNAKLNPNLAYFQQITGAAHAFQVALDADFIDKNCFAETNPIIVPATTFLSQLV